MIALGSRRWRRPRSDELPLIVAQLERWPAPGGGAVRHLLPLAAIDTGGAVSVRITGTLAPSRDGQPPALGVVVRVSRDVLAVAGDAASITRAVGPTPTWRLLVGDAVAADALLARGVRDRGVIHDQRYLAVDAEAVPDEHEVSDPGVRRAVEADVDTLAALAVRLHVDDGFGPDPGEIGRRGYRARLVQSVRSGVIDVIGPVGAPVAKLERSVDHARYGVQLAGIVVAPERRGEGLGRGLVAVAVRRALAERARSGAPVPAVTLHTRAANAAALVAYRAAGLRVVEPWRLAVG